MKRVLAWILSFVMLASLLPAVQVRATEAVPLETVSISYINPLYADVMDESQFPQPGVMPLAEVEYLETVEEAGAALREGIKARQETIVIGLKTEEYTDELFNQIVAECHKHTGDPEEGDYIYWQYGGVGGSASGYEEGGYEYLTLTLTPRYYTTAAQEDQLDTEIASLLASLDLSGKDDYGKLKAIYDWMCVNITYDNEHVNDSSYTRMRTAYGALMDRTAVCQGYVALLYRLLLEVDIDNRVVAGLGDGGAHGWNIVELGGIYYNVDSTWDAIYLQAGVDYAYFLKTDETFSTDHVRYEEYTTEAFYAAYPMAQSDFVPGETELPEEPHAHSYTASVIDPTCTEKGYTVYTCSCGDSYTDNEIESLGHSWNDGEITSEPTVDAEGEMTYTCTSCGETMTEAIPKLEDHVHNYEWQYDEYEHWRECACGEVIDKGYHDAALMACGQTAPCDGCGVEIVWDREHEDGDGDDMCDACGWGMEAVAGGILEECCWVVENGWLMVYGTEEMPSLDSAEAYPWYAYRDLVEVVYVVGVGVGDHAFQGYDQLYGVLVSADGDTGRAVSVLGSEAFADNAALEYIIFEDEAPEIAEDAFRGVTAEVEYDGTWDENLLQDYGGTLTWTVTEDETHTHSYTETVTEPTCTEKGYTTYTCSCGDSYTDNETDPLGHSYEWQYDDYEHWQECACGETTEKEDHDAADMACGQTTLCEGCGVEIVWDREHEDADGDNFCDVCNWRMDIIAGGSGDGWLWGLADGVLQFSGSGEMPSYDSAEEYPWYRYQDQVEMVAVYGVDIGDHAFQGYPNLTYVYMGTDEDTGAAVSSIGAEAFGDCAALEEVVFGDEAPEIAEDAFADVTAQVTYNGTWDSSLCKDYGGSLTWVTEDGEEEHTHSYTETVTDPTCTEQGYTTYRCSCGDSYTDGFTDPLGHSWDEGKVTREPTVDAVGVMTYTCTACGETKTSTIPKLEEAGAFDEHSARARLTGDEALAYDALVPFLKEIAAGTRTSTEVKIGEGEGVDAEVKFTEKLEDFDQNAVFKALQIDFPYELYWNNYYGNSVVQSYTSQRLVAITFRFQVDGHYRGSGEFTTDPEKLAPAHTALANANAIAAKYDGKSDYEKLHGYWQEIMDLTEYATDREIPEKDIRPWQMVSVFDGDPNTKVICEGYSKAFQYLCNLGGLVCYPVEGKLSGGDHQWNIVTLDGKNYLVDVTNSEPGLVGQDGTLFLAGASGSVTDGYTHVNSHGQASLYTYREDIIPLWGEDVLTLSNHAYTCTQEYNSAETAPTCTEQGFTTYTCPCGYSYQDDLADPLGHSWKNGSCEVCGAEEPEGADAVYRLAGANRFETAFLVADQMKVNLGVEKFDAIIVASGTNFADALGGSYLSAVKNAPILLSYKGAYNEMAKNYIIANLKPGGTVYILGGPSAVPASMETGLGGFTIKRLAGEDRFGTNLAILQEAGVGDKDILVCTGLSFADSLSASASELPILLVWKNLTEGQKGFLNKLNGNKLYIIGGETAVSSGMEKQVSAYGETRRIGGKNRFETSVLIAEEFFDSPDSAVLAYAWNYPDGLCGGGLAAVLDAPLILTMNKFEAKAEEYIQSQGIGNGYVLGTGELISDDAVQTIFGPDVVLK